MFDGPTRARRLYGARPRNREKRATARDLRREGNPYKRIAATLGVSPSTVYLWTHDIALTPEQVERNRTGPGRPWNDAEIARRAYSWSRTSRNKRLAFQRRGRNAAFDGDPLHLAGCLLYWAEGSKGKNQVHFANSELPMMRMFKSFLEQCFDVGSERMTVKVNAYVTNGLDIAEIESYWLRGLGLPESCLRKPTINHTPTSSSGQRIGKLRYGVCSLRVLKSTEIVQHIFGAIQEYGAFERPEWVGKTERRSPL